MELKFPDQSRILLVDDRSDLRETLSIAMDQFGLEAVLASGADDALVQVEKGKIDLILLDIGMPDLDGFELCKILKEKESTASIPIIFITGIGSNRNKERAFALGGADFLIKPLSLRILMESIHRALVGSE